MSYLAKFSKIVNGHSFAEEVVFHKWVKSDFNYNHTQDSIRAALHNTLMQKLDDEQLERSGFVLNCIVKVLLEIYKVNDIQASSGVELPEKYKNNKSINQKLSTRDGKPIRGKEIYYNIWTLKEKLNNQDLSNLISDRAHLL